MKLFRRLQYLLNRRQNEKDLEDELAFHRDLADPGSMGNLTLAREDARAVWIGPWLASVAQDTSYALRNLWRQPGFALVTLLMLGVSIGINTSFFSLYNAVALRLWPVEDVSRVVKISGANRGAPGGFWSAAFGIPEFRYIAARTQTLSGLVLLHDRDVHFGFEEFGAATPAAFVAGSYFQVLGVGMRMGRGFLQEEDRDQAPEPVVVLSYNLWRDHFGSDMQIVGKQIRVEEIPCTVVGVAAEDFTGTSQTQRNAWFPLSTAVRFYPDEAMWRAAFTQPSGGFATAAQGRLAKGMDQGQATAEIELLSRQFRTQFGIEPARFQLGAATFLSGNGPGPPVAVVGLLFMGLALVILLACANVGNLLIARAAARQREISVRRSLGASRLRIIRQLLTESLVLALGAGVLGVGLGWWLPAVVLHQLAAGGAETLSLRFTPDWRILAYAFVLALFACVCFGLAPALHGTRSNLESSRLRLRGIFLAVQMAIAVVLLVSAGLLAKGVQRAQNRDLGFSVSDVSVVSFKLPAEGYDAPRIRAFFDQLQRKLPQQAGLAATEPLASMRAGAVYRLPGESRDQEQRVDYQEVSPGYFDVLRIPLLAGRKWQSGDEARGVAMVNEAFVRGWPSGNVVGQTIVVNNKPAQIIGVVRDANIVGDLQGVPPILFRPATQAGNMHVLVRSGPGAAESVIAAAAAIDPRVRAQTAPLSANVTQWLAQSRLGAEIAGALGVFALLLAGVGMFGVFAYVVRQRTKEIGIRMALGARPGSVVALVVSDSTRAVLAGVVAGFLAAVGVSRLLVAFLYGVSPMDPTAYASVAAILGIAALAATYIPVWRATRIDPVTALRHDS